MINTTLFSRLTTFYSDQYLFSIEALGLILFTAFLIWVIGRAIIFVCSEVTARLFSAFGTSQRKDDSPLLVTAFLTGTIFTCFWAYISTLILVPFLQYSFQRLFFSGMSVFFLFAVVIVIMSYKQSKFRLKPAFSWLPLIAGLLLFSVFSFLIFYFQSPYSLNWDIFAHQVLVYEIGKGQLALFTSQMSDSFIFNAYLPVFHILVYSTQWGDVVKGEQFIAFANTLDMVQTVLTAFIAYYFAYNLFQRRLLAVLTSIFCVFTFESVMAFSPYFFLPQTLAGALGVGLLSEIYIFKGDHFPKQLFFLLAVATVFMMHFVIGTVVIGLVCLFYIARFQGWQKRWLFKLPILETLAVLLIVGLLASQFLDLGFINRGEASDFSSPIHEKVNYLRRFYGVMLFLLIPVGIVYSALKRTKESVLVMLISIGFLVVFFTNIPYVFKFFVVGKYFISCLMVLGVLAFVDRVHSRVIKGIVLGVAVVSLSAVLILNVIEWKKWFLVDDQYLQLSQDEIAAAEFLVTHFNTQDTLLISDPTTQFYFEGLSGVNSAGGYVFDDKLIFDAALSSKGSVNETKKMLEQIHDRVTPQPQKRLLVISGRTNIWKRARQEEKEKTSFQVWTPHALSFADRVLIHRFTEKNAFVKVYDNESVVILAF